MITPWAAGLDDPLGEVLLERERDLVLQVDLDRDQQDVADPEDRDAVHQRVPARPRRATTSDPAAAQRVAAARRPGVALVAMSPNSMPSATIGLGDLRADAGDDALGAHQPGGHHGLEEVLGDLGVDRRHAGDVDDRVRGAGVDQGLQQLLHHDLGAGRVQGADQRHGDDAVPQLDHRRGQLEQLLGLVGDHLLAGLRRSVSNVNRPRSSTSRENSAKKSVARRGRSGPSSTLEHGLLEREDADRGLGRR